MTNEIEEIISEFRNRKRLYDIGEFPKGFLPDDEWLRQKLHQYAQSKVEERDEEYADIFAWLLGKKEISQIYHYRHTISSVQS